MTEAIAALSPRLKQMAVLTVEQELTQHEAAGAMGVSIKTAEAHRYRLYRALGITNVVALTKLVIANRELFDAHCAS